MRCFNFAVPFLALASAFGGTLSSLPYSVIDAEYSPWLDRIVMISGAPSQLHIYNGFTRQEVGTVDLPLTPACVSVSPDSVHAAVGHNAWVSYVNLQTAKVEKVLPIGIDVLDIVLAGNGYAYAFPRRDQWARIVALNLQSGKETPSSGNYIYAGTLGKLHPSGRSLYVADNGLSPSNLEKFDISSGPAQYLYGSPYWGDYPMCGNLWMSLDGLRIFTRCGNVFRASDARDQDMTYNGSLEGLSYLASVAHSSQEKRVAAIAGAWSGSTDLDTRVHFFGYEYLNYEGAVALPSFEAFGKTYAAHGKFVFASGTGGTFFVVAQADPSSGFLRDYAVTTASPNDATAVNAASYAPRIVAPEQIVSLFGVALTARTESAVTKPLPLTLGGVSGRIVDSAGNTQAVPLFFVSPVQINLLIPAGTALGAAKLFLVRENGTEAVADVVVESVSPGIFTANSDGRGVAAGIAVVVRADGSQVIASLFQYSPGSGTFVPAAIQTAAGEQLYLALFGTGLRNAGGAVTVLGNGMTVPVSAMVAHPDFIGLDQINLGPVPTALSYQTVNIAITAAGKSANTVTVLMGKRN
jgi:uncharacterized protein (TIGR03437 family)